MNSHNYQSYEENAFHRRRYLISKKTFHLESKRFVRRKKYLSNKNINSQPKSMINKQIFIPDLMN